MKHRVLGKTGLHVSMLGFGGFHLLEIPTPEACRLVNRYLDLGGNYIETAASYGNGESELKVGKVIKHRRHECVLATKTLERDAGGAMTGLETSLKNLNTDSIDVFFLHSVSQEEDLARITARGGALEAFEKAREHGKARFSAISVHGYPGTLIKALKEYPFDVAMATINYYDCCNFPELVSELIPLCMERNVGLMAMKPLADGYLWGSVESAFRYVWSLPGISVVVAGMNSMEMLETDIGLAERFSPMTTREFDDLLRTAPELGTYVCRQCPDCRVCARLPVKEVFKLEGYFDRQMRDGNPRTPPEFALRDRLRFWFGNRELARAKYAELGIDASKACDDCGEENCESDCRYGLPVKYKLNYAHYKLAQDPESF